MAKYVQLTGSSWANTDFDRQAALEALERAGFPVHKLNLHLAVDLASTNRDLLDSGMMELMIQLYYLLACALDDDELIEIMGFYDQIIKTMNMITPLNVDEYFELHGEEFTCQGETRLEALFAYAFEHAMRMSTHYQKPTVFVVLTDGLDQVTLTPELIRLIENCMTVPLYFIFVGHSSRTERFALLEQLDHYGEAAVGKPDIVHFVEWPAGHVSVTPELARIIFEPMLPWLQRIKDEGLYL